MSVRGFDGIRVPPGVLNTTERAVEGESNVGQHFADEIPQTQQTGATTPINVSPPDDADSLALLAHVNGQETHV